MTIVGSNYIDMKMLLNRRRKDPKDVNGELQIEEQVYNELIEILKFYYFKLSFLQFLFKQQIKDLEVVDEKKDSYVHL